MSLLSHRNFDFLGTIMPPLKKSSVKVPNTQQSCRVCLSDNPVMLELFGSETQSVSYAEDVNKCLSIEVRSVV